ncbi:MAG: hypothetical protein E7221_02620 [Clostridiales bacterium]|nr:hypothetical protein [Clostridiales bacterium]MBR0455255.1 hypothetical protein [Bacillota bacterium]
MSEHELTIRIDTRYNRFCIHRKTLKAIGNPAFVHLGYRADTKELMIIGTWLDDRRSIRVRYDTAGSFYINSKGLVEGIRSVSQVLLGDGSYIVTGEKADHIPAISFPLADAELSSEGAE